jgi:hypothetical protein
MVERNHNVGNILYFLAAVSLLLASCTPIPYKPAEFHKRLMADIGIPESAILAEGRCEVGWLSAHESRVRMQPCIYLATGKRVVFVDFDKTQNKYRETLRLDASMVSGVALQTFSITMQIQATSKDVVYIFSRLNPGGSLTDRPATTAAFEHLKSLGIPETAPRAYVHPVPQPSGPITIYIPSGG